MKSPATDSPPQAGKFFSPGSRRDFLKAAAVGSAAIAVPGFLTSCKVGETTFGGVTGGTGPIITIDFSTGDTAFLRFVSAYKQVQLDLYANIVANFAASDLTATEKSVITDIKNHEVIHLGTINSVLGAANAITITPTWGATSFKSAASVIPQAINFEDESIGLLNGMLQHFINSASITLALEMQSVEARHSAALRDELTPKSGTPTGYSPGTSDGAFALTAVASALQGLVVETLQFTNAPSGL